MSATQKIAGTIASIFLLVMAGFHGSGFFWITGEMNASNASSFLKEIFPILFVQPSIQLLTLAIFGFLGTYYLREGALLCLVIGFWVMVDAGLAFYLQAFAPGGFLAFTALLFFYAGFHSEKKKGSD